MHMHIAGDDVQYLVYGGKNPSVAVAPCSDRARAAWPHLSELWYHKSKFYWIEPRSLDDGNRKLPGSDCWMPLTYVYIRVQAKDPVFDQANLNWVVPGLHAILHMPGISSTVADCIRFLCRWSQKATATVLVPQTPRTVPARRSTWHAFLSAHSAAETSKGPDCCRYLTPNEVHYLATLRTAHPGIYKRLANNMTRPDKYQSLSQEEREVLRDLVYPPPSAQDAGAGVAAARSGAGAGP